MVTSFRDRAEAGRLLVTKLAEYADRADVLVLGLPRGGVPVAFEVARGLKVPLDVFLVRKLGVPGHEELGMGALASGGVRVLNDELIRALQVNQESIHRVTEQETQELQRRERHYRNGRAGPDVRDRTIILIDDGLATGLTMRAAARALHQQQPAKIVVAVPVASLEVCKELKDLVDEVIFTITPRELFAVGLWYEDFSQTGDDEVRELLERARREWPQPVSTSTA